MGRYRRKHRACALCSGHRGVQVNEQVLDVGRRGRQLETLSAPCEAGWMSELRALVVCTGNTCRSPMGEAILRERLTSAGIDAAVASAGTLGWSQRPASKHAVTVMAEMGLDIGGHVSRRIASGDLDVDLVVAMTRIHAGAVIGRDSELRPRVFLPSEFSRLATNSPSMGLTTPSRVAMRERIERSGQSVKATSSGARRKKSMIRLVNRWLHTVPRLFDSTVTSVAWWTLFGGRSTG